MEEREVNTNIDDLEIEPLSDDALSSITGADSKVSIPPPCISASCSGILCSSDELSHSS